MTRRNARKGIGPWAWVLFGFGAVLLLAAIAPPPERHRCDATDRECLRGDYDFLNDCETLRDSGFEGGKEYAPECFGEGRAASAVVGVVCLLGGAVAAHRRSRH